MQAGELAVPRACWGTVRMPFSSTVIIGLSPRVRGNHVNEARLDDAVRSIPARAGEPMRKAARMLSEKVYPRACGGTALCSGVLAYLAGLSPRVRGNRADLGLDPSGVNRYQG